MAKLIVTRTIIVKDIVDVGNAPEDEAVGNEMMRSVYAKRMDLIGQLQTGHGVKINTTYKYIPDDVPSDDDLDWEQYLQTNDAQEQIRAHNEEMVGLHD